MRHSCTIALILLVSLPIISTAEPPLTVASLQFENDAFTLQIRDRWYSNGFKFNWVTNESEAPDWLQLASSYMPLFEQNSASWWGWSMEQRIFTPGDISEPAFPPEDRPYAGWLSLDFSQATVKPNYLERIHFGIGLTGEPSLAEETQDLSHDLLHANEALGWDTQLPTELTLLLSYNRQWRLGERAFDDGYGSDWAPNAGLTLGNAITSVEAGVFWRSGRNLPDDFGPPRITTSPNGAAYFRPSGRRGWYWCIGTNLAYRAHDLFLDGTTFRDSPSVESEPVVGEAFAAFVYHFDSMRFSYLYVRRSKEFENQDEPQNLAAITFSWALDD